MIIQSISHRGLRRFIEDGNRQEIGPRLHNRISLIVGALKGADYMSAFIDEAPPGWHVHRLSGNRQNEWSVSVSGNWRLTFQLSENRIHHLNLEDYH